MLHVLKVEMAIGLGFSTPVLARLVWVRDDPLFMVFDFKVRPWVWTGIGDKHQSGPAHYIYIYIINQFSIILVFN